MKNKSLLFKMKVFVTILLGGAFLSFSKAQSVLEVATGTDVSEAPVYIKYYHSYTQTIYLQSELTGVANSKISEIAYYIQGYSGKAPFSGQIQLYIAKTTKNVFASASDYIPLSDMNLYYDGIMAAPNSGANWVNLILNKPFIYDGNSNIVIAVVVKTKQANWYSSGFYGKDVLSNRVVYSGDDNSLINTDNPTSARSSGISTKVPSVRFTYSTLASTGEISVNQTVIDFDYSEINKTATKSVDVFNYGLSDLTITGVSGIAAPFSVSTSLPLVIPSMQSKKVDIAYTPTVGGDFNQNVTITHDGAGSAALTLQGKTFAAGSLFESFENKFVPDYWRTRTGKWTKSSSPYHGASSATLGTEADTLITPKVSGNVSVYVKQSASGGEFKILSSADLVNWTDITPAVTLSATYQQAVANVPSGAYIGFAGNNIIIDLVQADQVTYPETDMFLTSWTVPTEWKQNTNVQIPVTVKNWGKNAESAYTVYLKNAANGDILVTQTTVPAIQPLEEKTINLEWNPQPDVASIYAEVSITGDEDLTNNKSSVKNISVVPYIGVLEVTPASIDFGLLKTTGAKTIDYKIKNTGIATLTLSSISVNAPFSDLSGFADVPIDPQVEAEITVSFDPTVPGVYQDVITFTHDGKDGVTTVPVKGELYKPGDLYEDFNQDEFPSPMWTVIGNNWERNITSIKYEGTASIRYNNTTSGMLVTPKLNVTDGDKVTFYARSWSTSTDVYIDVKISSDMVNWVSLKKLTQESGELNNDNKYTYYSIPILETGEYFIGFEAKGDILMDVIRGPQVIYPGHDLYAKKLAGPVKGKANKEMVYTLSLVNYGNNEETDYTVSLTDGTNILTTIKGVVIAPQAQTDIQIPWTPNFEGTYSVYAVVDLSNDENLSNNTSNSIVNIKIDAENLKEIHVGEAKANESGFWNQNSNVPLYDNWRYSVSETLYYPDELSGIAAGDDITSIGYPYFNTQATKSTKIRIWIANTTVSELKTELIDPASLSLVYENSSVEFLKQGNANAPASIWFDLQTPVSYAGGNLIVVIESDRIGVSDYPRYSFYADNSTKVDRVKFYRHDSNKGLDANGNITSYFSGSGIQSLSNGQFPVTMFKAKYQGVKVSGTISEKAVDNILSGATVKLTAGNLLYETTSEADGSFVVDVYTFNTEYTLTVEKTGYISYTQKINVAEADVVVGNVELERENPLSADQERVDEINVYPNPVSSVLHISGDYEGQVTLTDLMGKQVFTGYNVKEISVDKLSSGVYILKIDSSNGIYTKRVIKK
ncbi:MAG: choice-of-anchor D domain-containing protein [Dysgonomonas sp.]